MDEELKRELLEGLDEYYAQRTDLLTESNTPQKTMEIRGRELTTGLPENKIVTSEQIQEAIQPSIEKIIDLVRATLEKTPPELASDIVERGIVLTGGGALIKGIDTLRSQKTEIPVYIAARPLDCVANGTGKTIEDMDKLRTALIRNKRR